MRGIPEKIISHIKDAHIAGLTGLMLLIAFGLHLVLLLAGVLLGRTFRQHQHPDPWRFHPAWI